MLKFVSEFTICAAAPPRTGEDADMKNFDFRYVCTSIGNLAGMPVRLYKNGRQVFYYSVAKLPKDPLCAYERDILAITGNVGYFVTNHFNYYGIVNSGAYKIVIGPTRQTENSDQELKELAFRAGVEPDDTEMFVAAMKTIIRMPLESVMQMMCMINYILNDEKTGLEDVILYEPDNVKFKEQMTNERSAAMQEFAESGENVHNTLELEKTIMSFISQGQTEKFKEWVKNVMPTANGGKLAREQLRHLKNTLIVTVTLAARAAIRGGMDTNDALSLSDRYIQKCELMTDPMMITTMQYRMIADYCERVEKIRQGSNPSKLVIAVTNYIQHHLSEPITTERIAEHLFMGRTRLSANFKAQSGMALSEFVQRQKLDEGKRLLRFTDKSAAAIAAYLGYSSPAHFTTVFKKYFGCTPAGYREKHGR